LHTLNLRLALKAMATGIGKRSLPARTLAPVLAASLVALLLVACGDDEELGSPTATPTGLPGNGDGVVPGGGFAGTVVADPSPLPAPETIPSTWSTFSVPASALSEALAFQYPPTWTVTSNHDRPGAIPLTVVVTSWKREGQDDGLRAGGTKIDLIAAPVEEQISCEPAATTPATFGGVPGFYDVMMPTADDESGIAKVHLYQAEHEGFRYCAVVYLGSGASDEDAQEQVGRRPGVEHVADRQWRGLGAAPFGAVRQARMDVGSAAPG